MGDVYQPYSIGSTLVAVRDPDHLTWLAGEGQGSNQARRRCGDQRLGPAAVRSRVP